MSLPDIVYHLLGEPLSYVFFQHALVAVVMIGAVSGVVGSYVVIRGMAFFADALAHAVLPGVAIAYLIGGVNGPLAQGAFIVGGLSAVVIGFLTRGGKLKEDTAIGIVFTTMLAIGIGIMSVGRSYAVDLNHILIGNILAISDNDLAVIIGAGCVVLLLTVALYKELMINAFDPMFAQTLHLPSEGLRYLLLLMLALTIVISLQAVGVVLIAALLVTPAAAALLLTRRLHTMMLVAALIGSGGGAVGILLSWHLNIAPSAAIVVTISLVFLVTFLFAPGRGLFRRNRISARLPADAESGT
jgi:manganese/iron transport system permease protein